MSSSSDNTKQSPPSQLPKHLRKRLYPTFDPQNPQNLNSLNVNKTTSSSGTLTSTPTLDTPITSLLNLRSPPIPTKTPVLFPLTPDLQSTLSRLNSLSGFTPNQIDKDLVNKINLITSIQNQVIQETKTKIEQTQNKVIEKITQPCINETGVTLKQAVFKTEQTRNMTSRIKVWQHKEEVFLIGCVMDRFFKRGSLASTRKDVKNAKKRKVEEKDEDADCWGYIKKKFDQAWIRFEGKIDVDRSPASLARHYKVMKSKAVASGGNGFRQMFMEWECIYNVGNRLMKDIQEQGEVKGIAGVFEKTVKKNYEQSIGIKI
eukprot:snap_masked-scaffold_28-processed-gene-2.7-mRNA-1 protein AED:0.08 eAED:1.00 QI:0/0/0/0.5/1/1/2/0/316